MQSPSSGPLSNLQRRYCSSPAIQTSFQQLIAHVTKISKSKGYAGLAALAYAQGRYKHALSYAKQAETLNPEFETETTRSIASVAEIVNTSQQIDDVMDHLTEILLAKLRDAYPIQGRIARTTDQGITLNIGLEQGVTPGLTLEVYANEEPVALAQKAAEFFRPWQSSR